MKKAQNKTPQAGGQEGSGKQNTNACDKNITKEPTASAPPGELPTLPAWLIWRFEYKPGKDKPLKVPYYAAGGRRQGAQGSAGDRAKLVPFATAWEACQRRQFDGVGLALLPEWGLVALDFDKCVQDGRVDSAVEALVSDTYAELSPSGKGVRAFLRGNLVDKKSRATPERFGFETFSSRGYATFTGRVLDSCALLGNENTLAAISPEVLDLYEQRFGLPHAPARHNAPVSQGGAYSIEQLRELLAVLPAEHREDYDLWLRVGMALHHETEGGAEGLDLWDAWSSAAGNYAGREDLATRWNGFGRRTEGILTGASLEHLAGNAAAIYDFEDLCAAASTLRPQSANEILSRDFPPLRWVVPRILPEGVFLLVASPKIGKSWLALQMALGVATGGEVLGETCPPGAALYLALEDNYRRLQARLRELNAELLLSATSGAALQFETTWPRAGEGGAESIDKWLEENPGARLVVVDVLERFRPQRKSKANLYAEDYEALRALKAVADKHRIGILVVHHTRKGATEDPMEMVSGTQGLAGSADGMLMLERSRGEGRGKLHVIGRDIEEDGEYIVEFSDCRWTMLGTSRTVAPTMERQAVLNVLKTAGGPLSAVEVAEALGKKRSAVSRLLTKLVTDGVTARQGSKYLPAVFES